MKKSMIFFSVLLCASNTFAQHEAVYKKSLDELIEKSEYIFEGIPFKDEYLHLDSETNKKNFIRVTRTIKGSNLGIGDTVHVLEYNLDYHSNTINNFTRQIFFCKTANEIKKGLPLSFILSKNESFITLDMQVDTSVNISGFYARGFTRKENFYKYLSKQKGIKVSDQKRNNLRAAAE